MSNIENELAKADSLISDASLAPDHRESMELGHRAIVELLGAILIEISAVKDRLKSKE